MQVDALQIGVLQDYLRRRGWLDSNEVVLSVEKPGDGVMNYTLRVTTAIRSLIVKQSKGYIEQHPDIPAPANRAVTEGRFYQEIQPIPMLANAMPLLMGVDGETNILVLDDLGPAQDFTFLYQPDQLLTETETTVLTDYLSELHYHFAHETPGPVFVNPDMRLLNHRAIFQFLDDTSVDTHEPELQAVATTYRHDVVLQKAIRQLGEFYLEGTDSGHNSSWAGRPKTLLHGDYQPGSWLRTRTGDVKIIDPEFCFYGPAEFDLGVMLAHLMLAQQPHERLTDILSSYEPPEAFDDNLRQRFTGVEIMRRLLGTSRLPLSLSIDQKQALLSESYRMLV